MIRVSGVAFHGDTEMDSTIVASLIAATASIVVAMLNRDRAPAGGTGRVAPAPAYTIPKRNLRIWTIAVGILIAWMVFAALFLHWDLAGSSFLAIPLVIWILSAAAPIKPSSAAATALFLFPFAFAAEPVGKWRRGMHFESHFEFSVVATYIGLAFGTALIAWLIAAWRGRANRTVSHDEQVLPGSSALARGLAELAELHRAGVLSDEEFARAKGKLLSE